MGRDCKESKAWTRGKSREGRAGEAQFYVISTDFSTPKARVPARDG